MSLTQVCFKPMYDVCKEISSKPGNLGYIERREKESMGLRFYWPAFDECLPIADLVVRDISNLYTSFYRRVFAGKMRQPCALGGGLHRLLSFFILDAGYLSMVLHINYGSEFVDSNLRMCRSSQLVTFLAIWALSHKSEHCLIDSFSFKLVSREPLIPAHTNENTTTINKDGSKE